MSFLSCWENFFAPWGHVWASILAGCLWAVSDFTCVEVIYKQAQASGLCIWMAERCDKTEARWSLPYFTLEVCFLRSSQAMIIEDRFSCHFDPCAYVPARSRRRCEAGQHCHSQTCVGLYSFYFHPATGLPGSDTGSQGCPVPLCPTLSKLCEPPSEVFRACASKTAPTKTTHFSYHTERIPGCVRNVDFSMLEKNRMWWGMTEDGIWMSAESCLLLSNLSLTSEAL